MKRFFLQFIIVVFFTLTTVSAYCAEKPKVVLGITVSNFYPEWLSMYADKLSEEGLWRLLGNKMMYADYNYLYSQSVVDVSTLVTGMMPSQHGIVAKEWYDRLQKKRKNCALTGKYTAFDGSEGYAPDAMRALSMGTAFKVYSSMSKVYSVAVDGDVAVLSGGNSADMAFWFSEKTGKWTTSNYYAQAEPKWLSSFNASHNADKNISKGWSGSSYRSYSNAFNYDLSTSKRNDGSYLCLKNTPYLNSDAADLVVDLIENEKIGLDEFADLLMVGFNCLDYINRTLPVGSSEFVAALVSLDKDVAKILAALDQRLGRYGYLAFMTFSGAKELSPAELQENKLSAGYFSIYRAVSLIKSFLNVTYGTAEWIASFDSGQIYLDRDLIEKKKLSLTEIQNKISAFLIEMDGVERVMNAYDLITQVSVSGSEMLFHNSFYQKRSGDVLFSLQPTWMAESNDKADYYNQYSKRGRVPVYLMGDGVRDIKTNFCSMIDVMPTICNLAGVPAPYSSKGQIVY